MKKSYLIWTITILLSTAAWAQSSAQTSTGGSATVSAQPAQPHGAPAQQPAGTTTRDDDAQMTRPSTGDAAGAPAGAQAPAAAPAGQQPPAEGAQAATMVHAELSKTVDARKAKAGDEVSAKTTTDFRTSNGTRVPRGTKLLGRVTEARKHEKDASAGAQSKLAFVFDRAVLKDKTEMPVIVVVQAIGAAQVTAPPPAMDSGMGATGGAQGSAGGPGLVGGSAGTAGSTVGGVAGAAGQTVGGVADAGTSTVGGAAGGVGQTVGAAGGMTADGRLTAQSQGVVGLEGLRLESAASSDTQAAVVTSDRKNVKLNSGTQLVLRVSAQ